MKVEAEKGLFTDAWCCCHDNLLKILLDVLFCLTSHGRPWYTAISVSTSHVHYFIYDYPLDISVTLKPEFSPILLRGRNQAYINYKRNQGKGEEREAYLLQWMEVAENGLASIEQRKE